MFKRERPAANRNMHMSGKVCKKCQSVNAVCNKRRETRTHSQGQSASAFGIDEEQSRDREDDLYSTIAQRGVQCLGSCVTDILKDCGAVERYDCKGISASIQVWSLDTEL